MDISPHQKRIATSIGLVTVLGLALVFQGWVLFSLLSIFCVLTLWEFYGMFRPAEGMTGFRSLGAAFSFLILGSFMTGDIRYPGIVLLIAFWLSGLLFLVRYSKDIATSYRHAAIFLAGLLYIPLNMHFFLTFNRYEILLVIGATALSDTAAFYAGTFWGKKKIWPQVSPKKSWAGSLGGMAACMAGVTAFLVAVDTARRDPQCRLPAR